MCFDYTFIKILGFLYKKMVTLYDNTLKRYYHNNLFVYCLTLDLNICYICRNFVNLIIIEKFYRYI